MKKRKKNTYTCRPCHHVCDDRTKRRISHVLTLQNKTGYWPAHRLAPPQVLYRLVKTAGL
jgi:hypothetical protein